MNQVQAAAFIQRHLKEQQPFKFPSNKEYTQVRNKLLDMCEYLVNAYAVGHEEAKDAYEWLSSEIDRLDALYPIPHK